MQRQFGSSGEHQELGESFDGVVSVKSEAVNGLFFFVDRYSHGGELDVERERGSGLKLGENGGVSLQKSGGRGGKIEVRFEKGEGGER